MLEKLIQIFSGSPPLQTTAELFAKMQALVRGMIRSASSAYWGSVLTSKDREQLYETDIQVNKLQREIRKQVALHLAGPATTDVPYGLLLMSLVKDTERLGDYAKNLSEVHELTGLGAGDIPEGGERQQLRQIADFVESITEEFTRVYSAADQFRAQELLQEGKRVSKRCDALLRAIAQSDVSAAVAVNMALATRYYKRICGHLLNVLSSVVMPLHRLDYVDEGVSPSGRPPREG